MAYLLLLIWSSTEAWLAECWGMVGAETQIIGAWLGPQPWPVPQPCPNRAPTLPQAIQGPYLDRAQPYSNLVPTKPQLT